MYCVAALFARFEGVALAPNRVSFGRWLGDQVRGSWESDEFKVNRNSIERRLYRVARMSASQVRRELPLLLSASRVERPACDWDRLITDLTYWDHNRSIAKRWLQQFHRALGPPPDTAGTAADRTASNEAATPPSDR